MTPIRGTAAGALLVLTLAACGGGNHKTTAGTTATSVPATSTTAGGTSTTAAPSGSTTPVSTSVSHPAAHLATVRVARQEGFDRVVFEFRDQTPGYRVEYATGPVMNTEGREVAVAGPAKLVVHMEQATGAASYTGPARVGAQGTTQVQELARVEDFEAVLRWVVGVRSQAPFRVTTLTAPPRLVIDVIG